VKFLYLIKEENYNIINHDSKEEKIKRINNISSETETQKDATWPAIF
jgi:hypothetical protein